jgi:hypothetical protein
MWEMIIFDRGLMKLSALRGEACHQGGFIILCIVPSYPVLKGGASRARS